MPALEQPAETDRWERGKALDDTQPMPVLRDFNCPSCGMGTSRVGRACIDCDCEPGQSA